MTPLTDEEIAELHKLYDGGEEMALEWRAAVLAAHQFLLGEVERSRAALLERDARWLAALERKVESMTWLKREDREFLKKELRALLEEAGK